MDKDWFNEFKRRGLQFELNAVRDEIIIPLEGDYVVIGTVAKIPRKLFAKYLRDTADKIEITRSVNTGLDFLVESIVTYLQPTRTPVTEDEVRAYLERAIFKEGFDL